MNLRLVVSIILASLLYIGCSNPEDPPATAAPEFNVHGEGWLNVNSQNFHGTVIAANGYDLANCQQCHGNQYDGGIVEVSCRDCHTQPAGPEACNTCHGDFGGDANDPIAWAPPAGLMNETETTSPAVGAHQAHFAVYPALDAAAVCMECHMVPQELTSPGHIDADLESEVVFNGSLANTVTNNGELVPNPSYDENSNACGNSYCHGNWSLPRAQSRSSFVYAEDNMTGNNASPVWTDTNSAACGSCHNLPPAGHNPFPVNQCSNCHGSVVNSNGEIIDRTKHVNGMVNVFQQEYPMF